MTKAKEVGFGQSIRPLHGKVPEGRVEADRQPTRSFEKKPAMARAEWLWTGSLVFRRKNSRVNFHSRGLSSRGWSRLGATAIGGFQRPRRRGSDA